MERNERPTIMDGKVIEFAEGFRNDGEGLCGPIFKGTGPYLVSASRNRVVVHKAQLESTEDVDALIAALQVAHNAAASLGRSDRGNFNGDERPIDVPYPPLNQCGSKKEG